MKKTPLYAETKALGGKMVDYFGWSLPVQYQGIINEHMAVRKTAGLFDVSHMGEILVKGKDALKFLQQTCVRDLSQMISGKTAYTLMCDEAGGVIDDLLVYYLGEQEYLLVVNAANTQADYKWLKTWQVKFAVDAQVDDVSSEYAQIALQGPQSMNIMQIIVPGSEFAALRPYQFGIFELEQSQVLLSRTGYTGEDGFELYVQPDYAAELWRKLLAAGAESGLVPAGLGARDSLRLEAGMPLYGHELSPEINPLEAGLRFFVNLDKEFFIGREALLKSSQAGSGRKLIGICLKERAIARQGYKVISRDKEIGQVTSGGFAPWLQKSICMALIDDQAIGAGQVVEVEIRGRLFAAEVIQLPFYRRQKNKGN